MINTGYELNNASQFATDVSNAFKLHAGWARLNSLRRTYTEQIATPDLGDPELNAEARELEERLSTLEKKAHARFLNTINPDPAQ